MQFTQITTLLALAASVVALPSPNGGGSGGSTCSSGVQVCAEKPSGKCDDKNTNDCHNSGGTVYCCSSAGLVNALNCVNLLDGNTVSVPITLNLLNGGLTLPVS